LPTGLEEGINYNPWMHKSNFSFDAPGKDFFYFMLPEV
jgi:hypothetical protein